MTRLEFLTQMLDCARDRAKNTSDPIILFHAQALIHVYENEIKNLSINDSSGKEIK